ncbi:hypothetical protein GQ54DRAFT_126402 [Martensiomyces pterosporus]|nr:hypothetical protein GQ54DRAFT_126402 [Martensiomyces pterosporus]
MASGSVNKAAAKRGGRLLPAPVKRDAPVEILEEDEFTTRVSRLIERDFFPTLRQLRADNQALETGSAFIANTDTADGSEGSKDALSLDAFLSTHTSEDNASFKELLGEDNRRRDDRYRRAFGVAENEEGRQPKLLTHGSSSSGVVGSWKYTPRNALMFVPEALPGGSDLGQQRNEKRIVHRNTRMPEEPEISDAVSVVTDGSVASTAGYATPVIRGYKMVDPDDGGTPRHADAQGKGFRIMPTPRREVVGMRLASKSKESAERHKAQQRLRTDAMSPRHTPVRGAMLSPAARRLLERSHRQGGNTPRSPSASASASATGDAMLRESYNSPYVFRRH